MVQTDPTPGHDIAFRDVTLRAGLIKDKTTSYGSTWIDYDRDRRPDLFVNNHSAKPLFYGNRGGAYALIQGPFYRYKVDRHGCAWGEANNDGRVDLYCTQGADLGTGRRPNQLFLQTRKSFANRARMMRVRNLRGRGRSVNWLDFDSDGDLDLFVGNNLRRNASNVTFENRGGRFARTPVGLGHHIGTGASSWSDWDNDGDPDLLVARLRGEPLIAYENNGGRFSRVPFPGITDRPWRSAAWGDFDGDGFTDLHLVGRTGGSVFRNVGGAFELVHSIGHRQGRMSVWLDVDNDSDLDLFVVQGAGGPRRRNLPDYFLLNEGGTFSALTDGSWRGPRAGNGDSASAADHNNDGRIDLFITNGHIPVRKWEGPPLLLENRTRAANWIGVDLRGSDANPLGYGSRVLVTTETGSWWQEVTDGVNARTQGDQGHVHFGIGQSTQAHVRVVWPDGSSDCTSTSHGRSVVVPRGTLACP